MANIVTLGLEDVNRYMAETAGKVKDRAPFLRAVGVFLVGEYQRNMTSGLDPNGRPLAPVALWTRIAGKSAGANRSGRAVPLLNTGSLRNSMRVVKNTGTAVEVGWQGGKKNIAERMRDGTPGRMAVRERAQKGSYSGVRTAKSGLRHKYIRVRSDGGWITKRVTRGSVMVTPKKRDFFFIGNTQARSVIDMAEKWIEKVTA